MWHRIREIVRKEFYQALREPRMRLLLVLPPVIQLIVFGYAVNLDVENSRVAWMDQDHTPASRELRAAFQGSRYFQITNTLTQESEGRQLLDQGKVQAMVRVLPGFSRDILGGQTAAVEILVEGSNSNTAAIVSSYATQVVSAYANQVLARQQAIRLVGASTSAGIPISLRLPSLTVNSRVWFNPSLRSRNYFVPGVVVNIIALITIMLTAMSIVREKEIGTMEQLMVTPIRPVELVLGKVLPFALVGLLEVILVTAAALLVFRIPFRGSGFLLLGCSILFLLTTLGAGLFISTISQTQQQAMMASFLFFMPAFMLSGFTFPIHNMPVAVQYLTYANPLRYFVEIVRGIFLKGIGISILWPQMLTLTAIGLAVLGSSSLRFRKRLE
ncbi:MAG: ABC transporter permease [Acidobacteria bacterium]|nr:MAG: ABC transporter permease [Acidobacteriota bacterium]